MENGQVLILVLQLDPKDFSTKDVETIQKSFPGKKLNFRSIRPRDYREHAEICKRLKPAVVILSLDRPIPSLAMEHGVPHVKVTPNGLSRLVVLKPKFEPFEPSQT